MVLQALADGGVLVGIPRDMAERIAAHTMMVSAVNVEEGGGRETAGVVLAISMRSGQGCGQGCG